MKTIYTDRYALRLWFWLLLGAWSAYELATVPLSWLTPLFVIFVIAFPLFAALGFRARIEARRRGDDPTIYKVVDDA